MWIKGLGWLFKQPFLSGLCLFLFLPVQAWSLDLSVQVRSEVALKGKVFLALYQDQASFLTEAYFQGLQVEMNGKEAKARFVGLKPGVYALSAYCDLNGNGLLETSFFGLPKEPYGISKDPHGFFGPPSFKDSSFSLEQNRSIEVQLHPGH